MARVMGSYILNWVFFLTPSLGSAFLCTGLSQTDWLHLVAVRPTSYSWILESSSFNHTKQKKQLLFSNNSKQTPVIYPDWTNSYFFLIPETNHYITGDEIHWLARSGLCFHPWNRTNWGQPHVSHVRTRSGKWWFPWKNNYSAITTKITIIIIIIANTLYNKELTMHHQVLF